MAKRKRHARQVNGIIPLDKPVGLSSNQALQVVKRLYRAQKAGHTGSLDPIASGVLLLCMGEATKVSPFLLDADKHYRTVATLGTRTATGDAEGEVVEERPVGTYTDSRIDEVLSGFRGEIQQVPPMYSALKHKGVRLYELARKGVEVEREPRQVTIYRLDVVDRDAATITLEIECSKGTYVRTLVEDIGEALGCGAHVSGLRRVAVGPFTEENLITLDRLEALAEQGIQALDAALHPVDSALAQWPSLKLTRDMAYFARSGQAILVPGAPSTGLVRLYDDQGGFVGVGEVLEDGRVAPRRLVFGR